jgi:Domain of unknown function (DUF927)
VDTITFLRTILPSKGLYIAARLTSKGFRNQVCESIEELVQQVLMYDSQGVAAYHAVASFREHSIDGVKDGQTFKQTRTHKNVRALRSFFMDLDVKPGVATAFESQEYAIGALVGFCSATGLPIPMVVSSGGGIHIYWTLTYEVQPEAWKQTAEGLKALAAKLGFKADPACTADMARVLRPVGTWNRKDPNNPRPVELVADSQPVEYAAFDALIRAALKAQGVKPPEGIRKVESSTEGINQAFSIQREFPPCSGVKVAERCQQLGVIRDVRGNVPEPFWYAAIQLLCHAVEGDALIHQWSNGHPSYSAVETGRKIAQVRGQQLGPTLCATFGSRNPGGCDGCPFAGKISSPAQLGTYVASAPAPVVEVTIAEVTTTVTLPLPPLPFTRGEKGGIYTEVDGITHKIYDYDAFPVELAYDEQLGYETMRWRHWLPQEGWKECVFQSSLLCRPIDFETRLRDQHIQPLIRNQMAMYGDAYIRKLRTDTKMRQLFKAQGWKNEASEFVLGDKLYRPNAVVQAGFSHGAKGFLEHFRTKGALAPWRTLTSAFQFPTFEPHAFMLLTAFASPLLHLDGRQGFTVCALGSTGVGKSTMGKFLMSVYGHPDLTWIKRNDTLAARVERIGAYHSLPVYMDEITTITPKELRDLVYSMSTGKGRDSLKQDRTLREGVEWNNILVTSTNDSLQSKLQLEKTNPEAESMRLFEFRFPQVTAFGDVAKLIHGVVAENYGVAGALYIEHIMNNLPRIKREVYDTLIATDAKFNMDPKERFWSQAVALTLYGGKLAVEAGLIDFDPNCIRNWLKRETQHMRRTVSDSYSDAVSVLAEYLNEHVGERLVTTELNAGMSVSHARPTRGELSQRFEKDTMTLYISKKHIKHYLDESHAGYIEVRDDLMARGVLENPDAKKVLGAGSDYAGGQVPCWKVRMDHSELVGVVGV